MSNIKEGFASGCFRDVCVCFSPEVVCIPHLAEVFQSLNLVHKTFY